VAAEQVTQLLQAVAGLASWSQVAAAQGVQEEAPLALYVPAAHAVQDVAPAALYVPAAHAVQVTPSPA